MLLGATRLLLFLVRFLAATARRLPEGQAWSTHHHHGSVEVAFLTADQQSVAGILYAKAAGEWGVDWQAEDWFDQRSLVGLVAMRLWCASIHFIYWWPGSCCGWLQGGEGRGGWPFGEAAPCLLGR